MKSLQQLQRSIERFRAAFWDRHVVDRPPIAITDSCTFLPIQYLRRRFTKSTIEPADVSHGLVCTDYEHAAPHRRVVSDDMMPFSTPWRAIPWVEAMCGCPVMCAEGSLRPGHLGEALEKLVEMPIPARPDWLDRMLDLTRDQLTVAPADCFISPSILRGPADVVAALRGQIEFFLDVVDQPLLVRRLAERVNALLIDVLRRHFALVPPKSGGYVHSYGYWAPGPTVVIQNDAMGLCSPRTYRQLFWQLDAQTVAAVGPHVLYHLHSTGCRHYREILEIPGLAGLELSIESIGPSLLDLVPMMREVLERSRLILFVEHFFQQLPAVLSQIPHEGLFIIIPDTHIGDEDAFRNFESLLTPR